MAVLIAAHFAQAFYSFTYHFIKIILIVIILYNNCYNNSNDSLYKKNSFIYFCTLELLDLSDSC